MHSRSTSRGMLNKKSHAESDGMKSNKNYLDKINLKSYQEVFGRLRWKIGHMGCKGKSMT